MPSEHELLSGFLANPGDEATRQVYADWLEERGDARSGFLRAQAVLHRVEPDHPHRLRLEEELSRARRDLDREWLTVVEPERVHLLTSTEPHCECVSARHPGLRLHDEPQDTECDAWKKLVDLVERAAVDQPEEFAPLRDLSPEERRWIITLPPTIAKLKSVARLILYGSSLVRIPPEIGEMTSLREFIPYTSYRLHWFPYEITRSGYAKSTVSTRALYGNYKNRPLFARIQPLKRPAVSRGCSVCRGQFDDTGQHRVWISLRVGTDVLPLLVNACSEQCLARLPAPPTDYVPGPHRGGSGVRQPGKH